MVEDAILFTCAAGFTIWLIVRIVNRREAWAIMTGVAWLIIVAVGCPRSVFRI